MATQVTAQCPMKAPPRPATPERWQTAAKRAAAEGITVRQLAGSGAWVATSGTDPSAAYVVSTHECECQAAEFGDRVCKHRAALRERMGWLLLDPEPEPEPPAPPTPVMVRLAEQPCRCCGGHGYGYGESFTGRRERQTCWVCDASGVEPSTAVA